MQDWNQLMGGRLFVTDLGENQTAEIENREMTVGRYAVWAPIKNSDRHQVVEVGENLDALLKKYKIPRERICALG